MEPRLGLKFDPPTIVLEQRQLNKLIHLKFRLKNLTKSSNPSKVHNQLLQLHSKYFKDISTSQVIRLINMLIQEGSFDETETNPVELHQSSHRAKFVPETYVPLSLTDLQKVPESVLEAAKTEMNEVFEQNFLSTDDPNYIYDKKVDFNVEEAEPSDWDD